jgi:hypothetical protein
VKSVNKNPFLIEMLDVAIGSIIIERYLLDSKAQSTNINIVFINLINNYYKEKSSIKEDFDFFNFFNFYNSVVDIKTKQILAESIGQIQSQ